MKLFSLIMYIFMGSKGYNSQYSPEGKYPKRSKKGTCHNKLKVTSGLLQNLAKGIRMVISTRPLARKSAEMRWFPPLKKKKMFNMLIC
jgi:hypothetical protein